MVWMRITEAAELLEIRDVYMTGAEDLKKITLADAVDALLARLDVVEATVNAVGAGGGVLNRFRYVGSAAGLGIVIGSVVRERRYTVLQYDGIVPSAPLRLRSVVVELLPLRRYRGVRVRLLLGRNYLLPESTLYADWYRRYEWRLGRENAVYVEGSPEVLKILADAVRRQERPTVPQALVVYMDDIEVNEYKKRCQRSGGTPSIQMIGKKSCDIKAVQARGLGTVGYVRGTVSVGCCDGDKEYIVCIRYGVLNLKQPTIWECKIPNRIKEVLS